MINLNVFLSAIRNLFGGYSFTNDYSSYVNSEYRYCYSEEDGFHTGIDRCTFNAGKMENERKKRLAKKEAKQMKYSGEEFRQFVEAEYTITVPCANGTKSFTDDSIIYRKTR